MARLRVSFIILLLCGLLVACGDEQAATAPAQIEITATLDATLLASLPTASPEPSSTPTPTCMPNPEWKDTYTVQSGDTLGAISIAAGVTLRDMQANNCLTDRDFLVIGQILHVPNAFSINIASSPEGAEGVILFIRDGDLWTVKSDRTAPRQITNTQIILPKPVRSPDMQRVAFRMVSSFYLPQPDPTPTPTSTPQITLSLTPTATPSTPTPASSATPEAEFLATSEPAQLWQYDPAWEQMPTDIWTVGVDGNELIRIVDQGPRAALFRSQPVWSPDSEWIAFTEQGKGIGSLIVIRSDGTDRAVILTGDFTLPAEVVPIAPVWSPDGEALAFVAYDENNRATLQTVSPIARAEDIETLIPDFAYTSGLLWLPSEDEDESALIFMAFNTITSQTEWQTLDLDTKTANPISGKLVLVDADGNYRIEIESDELVLIGPDGVVNRTLPPDLNAVAWGPEGAQLVIGEAINGLLLLDLNEDIEQRVTNAYDLWPVWAAPIWVIEP